LPGLIGGFFHAGQEEAQPRFPIAGEADGLQEVVVLLAVLLEVDAEIQQRPSPAAEGIGAWWPVNPRCMVVL
jgi:hypothetical protein